MKESLKKKLARSRLKWAGHVERTGDENWQREQMPRKWREKGGDEDRECDGRTALREIGKEWEENGEQQQKIGELETGAIERSERKVKRGKKRRRKNDGNQPHP